MTDAILLKQKITESGLKIGFIAATIGISRQSLNMKINNKRPFNQFEIDDLCKLLHITKLSDRDAIFFAPNVDKSVNKVGV